MSYSNPRIGLTDSLHEALFKMSEGNPGAVTVMANLIKEEAKIDPDSALGGMGTIFAFDTCGIYGSAIWVLYKDVCSQDLIKLVALFRAYQLGFIDEATIQAASRMEGKIDTDSLLKKVQDALPAFAR